MSKLHIYIYIHTFAYSKEKWETRFRCLMWEWNGILNWNFPKLYPGVWNAAVLRPPLQRFLTEFWP